MPSEELVPLLLSFGVHLSSSPGQNSRRGDGKVWDWTRLGMQPLGSSVPGVLAGARLWLLGLPPQPAAEGPAPQPPRAQDLGAILWDEAEIQAGSCWEGQRWSWLEAGAAPDPLPALWGPQDDGPFLP